MYNFLSLSIYTISFQFIISFHFIIFYVLIYPSLYYKMCKFKCLDVCLFRRKNHWRDLDEYKCSLYPELTQATFYPGKVIGSCRIASEVAGRT